MKTVLIILFVLVFCGDAFAHNAKTDSGGCHSNGEIGGYHCHKKKVIKQKEAVQYTFSVSGGLVFSHYSDIDSPNPSIQSTLNKRSFQISGSPGFSFAVAPGLRFNESNMRVELEYSHKSINADEKQTILLDDNFDTLSELKGGIIIHSLMINLYHDYKIKNSSFSPYIGFGAGWAFFKQSIDETIWTRRDQSIIDSQKLEGGDQYTEDVRKFIDDDSLGQFAFQLMVGTQFSVTESSNIIFGYRYFGTQDVEWNDLSLNPSNHSIEIGWSYSF